MEISWLRIWRELSFSAPLIDLQPDFDVIQWQQQCSARRAAHKSCHQRRTCRYQLVPNDGLCRHRQMVARLKFVWTREIWWKWVAVRSALLQYPSLWSDVNCFVGCVVVGEYSWKEEGCGHGTVGTDPRFSWRDWLRIQLTHWMEPLQDERVRHRHDICQSARSCQTSRTE